MDLRTVQGKLDHITETDSGVASQPALAHQVQMNKMVWYSKLVQYRAHLEAYPSELSTAIAVAVHSQSSLLFCEEAVAYLLG